MKKSKYNIAVVGATGVVGAEMIKVLEERDFPVGILRPLASERSIGRSVEFGEKDVAVDVLNDTSFKDIDIALFSAGGEISLRYAPIAAAAGAVVVDNTSVFRMEKDVPLIVPEVNPERVADLTARRIIANPNCSTIQMVVVLAALRKLAKIKRVVVSTYQSVSGAGLKAMEELSAQSVALFSQKDCKVSVFPHRIAFNCIPHIDKFLDDGSTKEEAKMVNETKKILNDDSIGIAATAVRVPVFCGHSEAVNIEFDGPVDVADAKKILSDSAGVEVIDDTSKALYPLAIEASGKDPIYVGRIRRDGSVPHGLAMWIVADNLRKGAALNAVQIAEILIKKYL